MTFDHAGRWRRKTHAQKIDAVVLELDQRRLKEPSEVARALGISANLARQFLRLAALDGRAIANPDLDQRSTGAAPRYYRLPRPNDR
jgi:hypothetical protein